MEVNLEGTKVTVSIFKYMFHWTLCWWPHIIHMYIFSGYCYGNVLLLLVFLCMFLLIIYYGLQQCSSPSLIVQNVSFSPVNDDNDICLLKKATQLVIYCAVKLKFKEPFSLQRWINLSSFIILTICDKWEVLNIAIK